MIKIYKNGRWYPLVGQKIFFNKQWVVIKQNDKLFYNGSWHSVS